jgi:hypothetical protein
MREWHRAYKSLEMSAPLHLEKLAWLLQEGGKLHTTMKKRHSSNSPETPMHPNLINYLALIHAVTHPGTRAEPGKHHRSSKVVASTVAAG